MKHLFIGDLHLGVNENDENFIQYQIKSLSWILKTANELEVTNIHFLGDIFHNRTSLSLKAINMFNHYFSRFGDKIGMIVVGNHDCFYKNSNQLNSVSLLANQYNVVSDKCEVFHDIMFVPWINKENVETLSKQMKKVKAKYCAGHFELSGFKMGKGIESQHDSIDRKFLNKFDLVISGHYHSYSHVNNICYLGTPYEMNFNDEGEDKFIGLFEDGKLELIKNPYTYFKQVVVKSEQDILDISNLTDKKVKVKLECDKNIQIEKWLQELKEKVNCDISEVNEKINIDENITINKMELIDVWNEFLTTTTLDVNKEEINNIFLEEYYKVINGGLK